MKKILLLSLMGGFVLSASAQNNTGGTTIINGNKKEAYTKKFRIDSKVDGQSSAVGQQANTGAPRASAALLGVKVGETAYDLQTNSAMPRRIINHGNGKISLTWTTSTDGDPYSSRGTGYNHYDGTTWKLLSDVVSRLESVRTGFPGIVALPNNQEATFAHLVEPFDFQRSSNTSLGGLFTDASIDAAVPLAGGPNQTLWCRVAAGGPDGLSIHMVSSYDDTLRKGNGVRQPTAYSRSLDGGVTWDKQTIVLPGYDSTRYRTGSAEDYAIDVNGSNVAIVIGGLGDDMALWKSTDNGETFIKSYIQLMDFPSKDILLAPLDVELPTNDGSMSVTVDAAGAVRVVFALGGVENATGQGSVFFPGRSGLLYWDDVNTTLVTMIPDLGVFDVDGDMALSFGVNSTAATISATATAAARYGNNSILHKPSLCMNATSDSLYTVFSMITDNDTTSDSQGFRDIFIMASNDNGVTWSTPVNLTQSIGFEEAFPSGAKLVDGFVHIVYQEDYEPGTELTNADANSTNDIKYLKVPVQGVWDGTIGFNEFKKNEISLENYPNPFNGSTTIVINTDKKANINFSVTNIFGEVVANNNYANTAGQLKINFDGSNLAGGVYFYTVRTANQSLTKKMIIQK